MSEVSETHCFYHPERPAVENCTECRQSICLGCQMQIAGKAVCQSCVSAIRQRVAGEMSSAPGTAPSSPLPSGGAYAYAPDLPPMGVMGAYQAPVPELSAGQIFGGLGLGFVAGLVGLISWVAFVYFSNWNIALLAVALGWLIGVATTKGAGGRGGNVVAVMSALLAFIFCGIGFIIFLGDGQAWDWIFGLLCLFFGVQQAYKTPMATE